MQEEEMIYEEVQEVEVPDIEIIDVEMSEAFPATGESDALNHATLNNREISDAHPITAITGLRKELDTIKALQTVYSDKKGNADYYAWAGGLAHEAGYFVTLNKDTISICTGDDIFGVVVDDAAFIGGQDGITLDYVNGVVDYHGAARDMNYGLVATSGAVLVRCESDIIVGDYVVSNAKGEATRAVSKHGYKVTETDTINDVSYAMINLSISAYQADKMGAQIQNLDGRMEAAESNIVSAINVANEAYEQAQKAAGSASLSEEEVKKALESILEAEGNIEDFKQAIEASNDVAADAKVIAQSALEEAESIKQDAVDEANKALVATTELNNEFELMENQITNVEDQVTIVTNKVNSEYEIVDTMDGVTKKETVVYYAKDTKKYHYYDYNLPGWAETTDPRKAGLVVAIAGIQVETDEHSANINNLVSWQGEANVAMARIEHKADANGAYIQHTVSNIDKYSVGPHSQAYGFTRKQAQSVLEADMIYVPIDDTVTEEYVGEGDVPTYTREFLRGYLYRWGEVSDGYGWITVDQTYSNDKLNTSAPTVYFSHREIDMYKDNNNDNYGYWYTNVTEENPTILDVAGNETNKYEPYTLYKWDLPYKYKAEDGETDVEERRWVAVATLAGNSQMRAVSQIRQDANSITAEIVDAYGNVAGFGAKLSETESTVHQLSKWANNGATIQTVATDNGSAVVIASYSEDEETGEIAEQARLVLNVVDSDDGTASALSIDADHINFTADDYSAIAQNIKLDADNIVLDGYVTAESLYDEGTTTINGSKITTGTIKADQIAADAIETGHIKSDSIEAGHIKANAITADKIETNAIKTKHIASDAIRSLHIESDAIKARHITADAIGAEHIQAGAIEADKIATDAIRSKNYYTKDADGNETTTKSGEGMKLDLANGTWDSAKFQIDSEGKIIATDGEFTGTIHATDSEFTGTVTATSGSFTDCTINDTCQLKSDTSTTTITDDGLEIYSASLGTNAKCDISAAGVYTATLSSTPSFPTQMVFGGITGSLSPKNTIDTYGLSISTAGGVTLHGNNGINIIEDVGIMRLRSEGAMSLFSPASITLGNENYTSTTHYMYGAWKLNTSSAVTSDRNLKRDIAILDDSYTDLFDSLQPVKFKYNNGTSDRYHTGFIAQDVCEATENAGLTTNDFAAYVEFANNDGDGVECGLRYEEFIALCVSEIQKLKKRVEELEEKLNTTT